jgi:Leucine-rich repeat (LRR) protein
MTNTIKKYPYKFLDAYNRADKDIFKGRNEEIETLYKMVFETDIMLVYGASGTGKTSLIQCGLANKFKTYDWLALNIRRGQNINGSLDRALCAESDGVFVYEKQGEQHDIKNLNKKLETIYLNSFRPIYLIFDQFEELYILGNAEKQNQFIQHVKAILELEQPVKMIFSIREEYLGYLYDFERIVPQLLQKKLRVEPMNITKVQEVIAGTTTLASSNISIKNEEIATFTEGIFKILQGEDATGKSKKAFTIQLPYLQVLLDKIYLNQTHDKTHQTEAIFTTNDLTKIGKIDDVLRDFLEEQVILINQKLQAKYPTIKAETIWQILSPFVTLEGTKEPITTTEIHNKTQTLLPTNSAAFTQDFLDFFSKRIIRYIEQDDTYEIAHDALAAKIAEKRSDEEIALLEVKRLIKSQTAIYQTTQEFYTEKQLNVIEPYLAKLDLNKTETDLITESKEKVITQKEAKELKQAAELKAAKAQAAKEKGLRRRAVYVAVAAMMIAVIAGYFYFEAEKANELAESNLFRAAVIAQHSDEDPLFEKYNGVYNFNEILYSQIDTLSFSGWSIAKIPKKIFQCKNLKKLDLSGNEISDYSFLENLTNLTTLHLSFNRISDYSFLEKMTNLTTLDLSRNDISDIHFLENLTNLTTLDLNSNQISDIRFLENLTNLITLDLSGNKISDIRFLEKMINLTSLDLSDNEISDIRFSEKMTNLITLDLSGNKISDIRFLENLTNLITLDLSGNKISDIRFSEKMTNLTTLYLNSNQISDIRFLEKMTNLTSLYLNSNQISDIRFLEKMINLTSLDLSDNEISDYSFLEKLTNLISLYLNSNQVSDIRFLENLTNLTTLDLSRNQVSDIRFLENLTNLTTLDLSGNKISDIRFSEK